MCTYLQRYLSDVVFIHKDQTSLLFQTWLAEKKGEKAARQIRQTWNTDSFVESKTKADKKSFVQSKINADKKTPRPNRTKTFTPQTLTYLANNRALKKTQSMSPDAENTAITFGNYWLEIDHDFTCSGSISNDRFTLNIDIYRHISSEDVRDSGRGKYNHRSLLQQSSFTSPRNLGRRL